MPQRESQWKTTDAVRLSRQSFLDVLLGATPLISEKKFVSSEVAERFEAVLTQRLIPYSHIAGPEVQKVGLAQFEFQAQSAEDFEHRSDEKARYFKEVQKVSNLHNELASQTGLNLWQKVFNAVSSLLPDYDVIVAQEGPGKKYFSGIYRAINESTPVHCDWSPYDSLTEDWIINRITHQAVFNLYLTPVHGGHTVVHDQPWTEEALEFRDPSSYGYHADVVAGTKHAIIQPEVGELCIFNTRNMHQVFPVTKGPTPNRPRLAFSSFMGRLPATNPHEKPKLIFWS
ncbi:hypothetical protein BO71DRAFT_333750 [Aspergillus ellipticus CBS 707.79]|uniref:Uncharacterized protein n=1 Tax=Aspergillus ellipticus CBS 707.79 TaxID=1448320 RepID=A0A319EIG6_9EURO|nr:hypothetical protein BO71DRAFT_333750 [Aspergillus ellipticus CBS 707.79]